MENWEDILVGYLEGTELRADAESLRWKIHLPAEVREEVEAVLRLADEVAAAIGSVSVPEGAVGRLQASLHAEADWDSRPVPARWRRSAEGFESTEAARLAAASREDAVNALIEGTAPASGQVPEASGSDEDEDLVGRLEQVRTLMTELSDLAHRRPPEGAVDRMLARFREDVAAGAEGEAQGGADRSAEDEAARQLLARLRTGSLPRVQLPPRPDVLAASAEGAADATNHDSGVIDPAGGGPGADPGSPDEPTAR